MLVMPIQSYVVRTPRSTVLVDSCIGNHKSVPWLPAWHKKADTAFMRGLGALGLAPGDIDYVLCTHLHADHCGWNTHLQNGRWVPTFPNARYLISRTECEAAEKSHREQGEPVYAENVLPLLEAGRAVLVADDHALDEHVRLQPTPGHTAGHCAVWLAGGRVDGVITGDLIHSPIQCAYPQWNYKFDDDQTQAAATRLSFLERHADSGTRILTAHFPQPSIGYVMRAGSAFEFAYLA